MCARRGCICNHSICNYLSRRISRNTGRRYTRAQRATDSRRNQLERVGRLSSTAPILSLPWPYLTRGQPSNHGREYSDYRPPIHSFFSGRAQSARSFSPAHRPPPRVARREGAGVRTARPAAGYRQPRPRARPPLPPRRAARLPPFQRLRGLGLSFCLRSRWACGDVTNLIFGLYRYCASCCGGRPVGFSIPARFAPYGARAFGAVLLLRLCRAVLLPAGADGLWGFPYQLGSRLTACAPDGASGFFGL